MSNRRSSLIPHRVQLVCCHGPHTLKFSPRSHRRLRMRSPQRSIRSSLSAAQNNASTRSTCSTPDPTAHDTSVLSASAQTSRVGGHPSGVAVRFQADTWCPLRCGVRRRTWRSCAPLRGTARSYPRTTTCGSRSVSCACAFVNLAWGSVEL